MVMMMMMITYTRKVDTDVIARLSSFGATAHKVLFQM